MKKRNKILLICIATLILVISISYAWFIMSVSQGGINEIVGGNASCLTLTKSYESAGISLNNTVPIRDVEGNTLTPYTLTINNGCNTNVNFVSTMELLPIDGKTENDYLTQNLLKVKYNENTSNIYSTLTDFDITQSGAYAAKMIGYGTIPANGEKTINVRMWVDESGTIENASNKFLSSKVIIHAGQVPSGLKYTVTINNVTNGTVDISTKEVDIEGSTTFNLTPTSGYEFYEAICSNATTEYEASTNILTISEILDKSICNITFELPIPDLVIADVTVNGTSAASVPNVPSYTATLNCANTGANWNYAKWALEISNGKAGNCNATFTTPTSKNYLNTYVRGLANNSATTGVYNENGWRYEGKNPNNYVMFNGELWRIIGVFDSTSHGVSGQYLTKIIRNDAIGAYAYDKSNTNDWPNSSLKQILNGAYLNSLDGTNETYCYYYSTSVPGKCDFTDGGIKAGYRSMIEPVTWYLGGRADSNAPTETFYTDERGTTVYSGRSTTLTNTKVGLMYPSDLGYSVPSASCSRTGVNLGSYGSSACGGNAWLMTNGIEWTITPRSSASNTVFYWSYYGFLGSSSARYANAARPTVYLVSDTYIVSGSGTKVSPYIIGK